MNLNLKYILPLVEYFVIKAKRRLFIHFYTRFILGMVVPAIGELEISPGFSNL